MKTDSSVNVNTEFHVKAHLQPQLTQPLYMQHCLRLEKFSWEGQTTVSVTHDTLYITRNLI